MELGNGKFERDRLQNGREGRSEIKGGILRLVAFAR